MPAVNRSVDHSSAISIFPVATGISFHPQASIRAANATARTASIPLNLSARAVHVQPHIQHFQGFNGRSAGVLNCAICDTDMVANWASARHEDVLLHISARKTMIIAANFCLRCR
jgi:hypothetical protein